MVHRVQLQQLHAAIRGLILFYYWKTFIHGTKSALFREPYTAQSLLTFEMSIQADILSMTRFEVDVWFEHVAMPLLPSTLATWLSILHVHAARPCL